MQSLWMLVAAFVFSLMAVCVKLVSDTYSTPEIVMYRSLIGAVFLFCMVLVKGRFVQNEVSASASLAGNGRCNGIRPVVFFHVAIASGNVDHLELHVADLDRGNSLWNRPVSRQAPV